MNGNSIVVDAAMALSVAVLSYFLYHLVQHRTAAEKAGRHVPQCLDFLMRHRGRGVRVAVHLCFVLLIGSYLAARLLWLPPESRWVLARGLARDYGLVAAALALVFGVGALAIWVVRRRGEGGRA